MEYQQIAAAAFSAAPSTDPLLRAVLERCGGGNGGLVFGTLLGPEATGPWPGPRYPVLLGCVVRVVGLVFLVSWLHRSCMVAVPSGSAGVWGVWYGVVV